MTQRVDLKERHLLSLSQAAAIAWKTLTAAALGGLVLMQAPLPADAEAVPQGQGLLWQIEAEEVAPSYLLGTMHTTDPQVLQLPAPVADAFASARSLTLELVMTEEVRQQIGASMVLTDGRGLDNILDADSFERVAAVGLLYGWPAQMVRAMKPWALSVVFSSPPSELARQVAGELPLDQMLQAKAEARSLPVYGLESAEEQADLFESMPEANQLAYLDWVVTQHGQVDQWFTDLRRLYLDRNTGGMLDLMREQVAGTDQVLSADFEDRLVGHRNQIMAERMRPRLDEGGAFVAVGALHLPGEEGILSLLEQHGYRVTPLY